MTTRILFPRLLVLGASLLFSGAAIAQSSEAEPRQTNTTTNANGTLRLETEPSLRTVSEESRPRTVTPIIVSRPAPATPPLKLTSFNQSLLMAMQSHVGADYHFNRTGPDSFDCSGFVWRAFQDVGLNFQRGPARSYWATMPAPAADEQFKFGNLVFFSNLSHVGIVVDEKGFYHSARHGGVMYSPFNEYWLSRIDGFRRVTPEVVVPAAAAKPRIIKPAQPTTSVEEDNQP